MTGRRATALAVVGLAACGSSTPQRVPTDAGGDREDRDAVAESSPAPEDAPTESPSPDLADSAGDLTALDGGGQTAECLASTTDEYRIVVEGTGFAAYEGKPLVVVSGGGSVRPRNCKTTGTTSIRDGAFRIEVTNLANTSYPTVDVFVDLENDGSCSGSIDPNWHRTFALVRDPMMFNLVAGDLTVAGSGGTCATIASR